MNNKPLPRIFERYECPSPLFTLEWILSNRRKKLQFMKEARRRRDFKCIREERRFEEFLKREHVDRHDFIVELYRTGNLRFDEKKQTYTRLRRTAAPPLRKAAAPPPHAADQEAVPTSVSYPKPSVVPGPAAFEFKRSYSEPQTKKFEKVIKAARKFMGRRLCSLLDKGLKSIRKATRSILRRPHDLRRDTLLPVLDPCVVQNSEPVIMRPVKRVRFLDPSKPPPVPR